MMLLTRPLLGALLCANLACSSGPPRQITWDDLKTPEAQKGQRIILEGYPGVMVPATNNHQGEQTFLIMDQAVGQGPSAQNTIAATAKAGTGPNQVEPLPEGYTSKDLKVHCADGSLATTTDKIRVTGKGEFTYGLSIQVQTIEKIR